MTLAISYLLTLIFVIAGTSVIYLRTRYAVMVCLIIAVLSVFAVWKLNMVGIERDKKKSME